MIGTIRQQVELQAAELGHAALDPPDFLRIGTGHDDLNAVAAHASHRDFFGTAWIDALRDRADHVVEHFPGERLVGGLDHLEHKVGAAGEIDAELDRLSQALGHGQLLLARADRDIPDERRNADEQREQHHADA